MHRITVRLRRALPQFGAIRSALVIAGVLGFSVVALQSVQAPTAQASAGLHFQQGTYLDNGWLCRGWTSPTYQWYHCTQHWTRSASGALVSLNTAWVPNGANGTSAPAVSHAAQMPASHPAPQQVQHVAAPAPTYSRPAAPAPTYTPPTYTAPVTNGSVQSEISAVFGPYAGAALNVARCESGFNPNAKSPISTASGVFQFLTSTWATTSYAGSSPFNASANIHAAYQVFQRDGYSWREWQCQP